VEYKGTSYIIAYSLAETNHTSCWSQKIAST